MSWITLELVVSSLYRLPRCSETISIQSLYHQTQDTHSSQESVVSGVFAVSIKLNVGCDESD